MKEALCFDDVLLVPKYSEINSRNEVDISSSLDESEEFKFRLPIISSPMDTVTESEMASAMSKAGGLGILHRYNSIEEQVELANNAKAFEVAAAIGVTGDYRERVHALHEAGVDIFCLDVAHGHHILVKNALKYLKNNFSGVHFMAGNVATLEGFEALAEWGADSIRVGIGGGSICSTRLVSGHGIPTFQSVLECAKTSHDVKIIADGGIKTSGDIVKAIAAGADFVMLGSMLAGTEETPGEVLSNTNGKKYKIYRGMASAAAQKNWRGKFSTPEGVSTTIPYKGTVDFILKDLAGGIRSGLSYSGCRSIEEFQARVNFIRQTSAGQLESNTHILWRKK
jgi:IMP dehydrogenase